MGDDHLAMGDGVGTSPPPRFNRFGQESQTGGWVKYEDHEAYVADLRKHVEVLSARLAEANVRAVQAEERCEHLIAVMAAHESVKATQPEGDRPVRS